MSNQDDWADFCKMMAAEGWEWVQTPHISSLPDVGYFDFGNGVGYAPGGRYIDLTDNRLGSRTSDWREWLAARTSPPPF